MSDDARTSPAPNERAALLAQWTERLATELGVNDLDVDIDGLLGLAGEAAHSVVRPAAPLTTFLVGYAAGLAAADGRLQPASAVEAASASASQLAQAHADEQAREQASAATAPPE
ncbi:DUF6457 domain-containing protein [Marisediminicola sp. LYQ134]|uniref:DUF6457 domain-containing protein n=1 Tax=unclassified Marisediminicola TaxID=2618316 RepID=UPI003982FFE0